MVNRSITANVSVKDFWNVVVDLDKYPEFVPGVKKIRIEKSEGNKKVVWHEVALVKTIHYTVELTEEPYKKITWTLVKGDFMKSDTGWWQFEELGPDSCKVTYNIDIKFGMLVPKSISDKMTEKNLPQMLEAFKNRAESLAKKA